MCLAAAQLACSQMASDLLMEQQRRCCCYETEVSLPEELLLPGSERQPREKKKTSRNYQWKYCCKQLIGGGQTGVKGHLGPPQVQVQRPLTFAAFVEL